MRVFITGITGTLGSALARLHADFGDTVFGCARSEARAQTWLAEYGRRATLFLGDCTGLGSLSSDMERLLPTVDRLYHCAAMKHVDLCETNPLEAFRSNVEATHTVAVACKYASVPMTFVSSDKACLPEGVYGATKLLGERVAMREGATCVRLGNIIGSSGSVFETWARQRRSGGRLRVTHPDMTRFFMSLEDAAAFVAEANLPGKVIAPLGMQSANMLAVAEAMGEQSPEIMGMRPGETVDQWLAAPGERLTEQGTCLIIGEGVESKGLSSRNAPRWAVDDLLEVAGVRIRKDAVQ